MKMVVVYQSLLGTTRKYAQWLRESLEADMFKASQVSAEKMQAYDLVVLCTATYIGRIRGGGYLKKRWKVLKGKKVILVVTGMSPAESADSRRSYEKIPEYIRQNIKYFKLPGKIASAGTDKVKKENLEPVMEYIRSLQA
jgi:menaquinone-dependent protoporphyrinogen IX oxidase